MKMKSPRIIIVAGALLSLTGCATAPSRTDLGAALKQTFASDDPCSNNARNIGTVVGAAAGIFLNHKVGNGNGNQAAAAFIGGMVGGLIGADVDRKRCELSKVAKMYDLEITVEDVKLQGELSSISQSNKTEPQTASTTNTTDSIVGSSVNVRDKGGNAGHFESGSDQLTPKAQLYFAAIAAQYAPETVLATHTDPKQKAAVVGQLEERRILLVGHTDDTGASQLNASLSERRAKAVALFLKQKGVAEATLYFQGAGETLPLGDNRTESGRSINRRVEIVELANETGFKRYLETRKPKTEFYRAENSPQAITDKSAIQAKPILAETPIKGPSKATIAINPTQRREAAINFGGVPYSPTLAKINTGGLVPEKGFSLISKAQAADDSVLLADCSQDRPRATGSVKSLRDGSMFKTTDHLPQLYGKTWASDVNGNLVVINRLSVLRGTGAPANLPELKVYANYKPGSNQKPELNEEPSVNSYLVDKGVLYRVFPTNKSSMKCMDILFGTDGATSAKAGKIIYAEDNKQLVADFKPQIQ